VVVDCRWYLDGRDARAIYDEGHIPGALFVDLDADLAGPLAEDRRGGRHPLPPLEAFAETLARLGVTEDSVVVAYDDRSGAIASRLWWMLRYVGHAGGRVLDGGLDAWTAAGQSLSTEPVSRAAAPKLDLVPQLEMVVDGRTVADRGATSRLVDARAPERFVGDAEPIDPRAGHIPGAVNRPWPDNLEDGLFASDEALEARYGPISDGGDVIVYCGSGVTACHNLLALALVGRGDAKLYVGSWSDWCSDPARPVATGEES
jgi:thiosulfate/3-mercaptopyruvate sulfurtransferase